MTVGVVIGRSPRTDELATASDIASGARGLFRRIKEAMGICARANEAAQLYEALRPLSQEALAAKGLKREDIPRAAFDRLTEKR